MAELSYTEFDDREVREFLKDIKGKTKKIKGADREYVGLLSAIVYADVINHFQREEGSRAPWQKWSKFYRERMIADGKGGNKILQDTGRLRNNFRPTNNRKVSNGILWFNNAKTKSGFPYAAAHNEGGTKLPMRDFMWLSKQAMDKIETQTLQFLIDKGI